MNRQRLNGGWEEKRGARFSYSLTRDSIDLLVSLPRQGEIRLQLFPNQAVKYPPDSVAGMNTRNVPFPNGYPFCVLMASGFCTR